MDNIHEILSDRRISRLYVEVFKCPTGFHSIEAMEKDILKKNEKIKELLKDNLDADTILQEDEKKFDMTALCYLCDKNPLIKKYLDEETKNHLSKRYGMNFI